MPARDAWTRSSKHRRLGRVVLLAATASLGLVAAMTPTPGVAEAGRSQGQAPRSSEPVSGARGQSMPVNPGPYRVQQPDGSHLTVVAWGDARNHGFRTLDGHAVAKDASGTWRYAAGTGASDRLAASHLDTDGAPGSGQGRQPLLVILVSFSDRAPVGSSEAAWAAQYFGSRGSLAAYYRDNSFNMLQLVPARETSGSRDDGVVGWLKMPYPHPNFAGDFDSRRAKLTKDALRGADRYVDYQAFDKDKDGRIAPAELRIAIVAAGYETSYGGAGDVCGPSVWAHQGALLDGGPKVDGMQFDRDAGTMIGEWMCRTSDNPGHMSTIGLSAALMGFDIGLPALFDRDGSSSGLGTWSLMAEGAWNRLPGTPSGTAPAMLDAFSKSLQGWVTPTGVFGGLPGAPLPPAETSPTAYRLLENPGGVDWVRDEQRGKGEYFLVENRQQLSWDVGLPACGVLVYHVDESVTPFGSVAGDRDRHRLVDIVEAIGTTPLDSDSYNGSAADVFPGSSGHVDFTDTTSPAARLYSGAATRVSMHVSGGCAPASMAADFAAPIPNDAFSAASLMGGAEGSLQGGTSGATKQAGEPAVAGDPGGASIWYRFTAPADGDLELSTQGSRFDTVLGVYRGTSVSSLKKVAENDNRGAATWSALTARVERGKTYRVAVDGSSATGAAAQGLSLLTYAFTPGNDDLRDAVRLTGSRGRVLGSTEGATLERKEPTKVAGQPADHSVWYSYKAPASGRLVVDLSGSDFDTLLAVYTGSTVSHLHRVAADDDSAEGRRSLVSFKVVRGTTYRIAVAGVSDAGKLVLRWHG
jgi:M6 family metalloprotease-like protein